MRTSPVPVLGTTDGLAIDLRDEPVTELRDELVIDPRDEPATSSTVAAEDAAASATTDGTMAISAVVVGLAALLAVLALWWLQVGPSCPPLTDPSCAADA